MGAWCRGLAALSAGGHGARERRVARRAGRGAASEAPASGERGGTSERRRGRDATDAGAARVPSVDVAARPAR